MKKMIATMMTAVTILIAGLFTESFAQQPPTISISLTEYAYSGPDGKSGAPDAPPVNIMTLKNGQTIQLLFSNDGMSTHTIVSPLFDAVAGTEIQFIDTSGAVVARAIGKDTKTIEIRPGWKARVVITPNFDTADDNGKVVFELVCHRNHGTMADHYLRGMKGTITVEK